MLLTNETAPPGSTVRRLKAYASIKSRAFFCYIGLALALSATIIVAVQAQDKNAKAFEKLVAGNEQLFVAGERVYRPKEVSRAAVVTFKPEPMLTDKASKKKLTGSLMRSSSPPWVFVNLNHNSDAPLI